MPLLDRTQDEHIEPLSMPFMKCWSDHRSKIISSQIILFDCHIDGEVLSTLLSAALSRDPHADRDWALSVMTRKEMPIIFKEKVTSTSKLRTLQSGWLTLPRILYSKKKLVFFLHCADRHKRKRHISFQTFTHDT